MHQLRALRALLPVVVALTALSSVAVAPAEAADDGNTSFAPADDTAADPHPFVVLKVDPGARTRDRVVLENRSDRRQTYDLYTADATSVDGAFVLSGADAAPTGVGSWLRLPVRTVVLGPGKSRTITFAIAVPANATPGDQAGGIVALPRATQAAESSSNVKLRARYGVGVRAYVRVRGKLQAEVTASDLSIDLSGGLGSALLGADSATVTYKVANSGNVILAPTSTGEVSTRTSTIDIAEHPFGEILPGSATIVIDRVDGLQWGSLIGRVHAKITVTAEGAAPVTLEASAWRVPWLTIVGLAALLLVVAAAIWIVRRRRGTPTEDEPTDVELTEEQPDPVPS